MQTNLDRSIRNTAAGAEADAILRKCVHCGFCTATCPTYQVLGDELDGPRGRIYLIKEMLEGAVVTNSTRTHLDRCLTCRSCETTCPSGVSYGRLLDIGRERIEHVAPRSLWERLQRRTLLALLSRRATFNVLLGIGRTLKPLLPRALSCSIPARRAAGMWPAARHARRMIILQGCVQPGAAPEIAAAAARVMDRMGVSLIAANDGCCGAMAHHLSQPERAREQMRRNIDVWWPHIEQGAEAIIASASGCGAMLKDYAHLLREDPDYARKAQRVSELFRDLSEVVEPAMAQLPSAPAKTRVAFQSPCTLQHGLQIRGRVERMLTRIGYQLTPVPDSHLCCGSAGTYSLLQPALSRTLRQRKLAALTSSTPQVIATANIGCLLHLQAGTDIPVRHWIELVDASTDSHS